MRYLDVADGVNLLVFEPLILLHSQSGGEWGSTTPTPPCTWVSLFRWRGYLLVVAISRVHHTGRTKNKSELSTVARTVPPGSHGWRHVSQTYFYFCQSDWSVDALCWVFVTGFENSRLEPEYLNTFLESWSAPTQLAFQYFCLFYTLLALYLMMGFSGNLDVPCHASMVWHWSGMAVEYCLSVHLSVLNFRRLAQDSCEMVALTWGTIWS